MRRIIFVTYRLQAVTHYKQLMVEDDKAWSQPELSPCGLPATMSTDGYSYVRMPRREHRR